MMKKNGFTLAEVLITLSIIGVVAVLTLPALMTNTAEQQAKTALKKGINTLTEAAQMNASVAGFDYSSLTSASTSEQEAQSLYGLLAQRTSMDFQRSKATDKTNPQQVTNQGTGKLNQAESTNFTVFFRDGSSLTWKADATSAAATKVGNGTNAQKPGQLMDDGLVYGIPALYDTNGAKGPNIVSNCRGEAMGVAGDEIKDADKDKKIEEICTKSQRVIKDQFGVRLRGQYAVPNGAAAQWAFNN